MPQKLKYNGQLLVVTHLHEPFEIILDDDTRLTVKATRSNIGHQKKVIVRTTFDALPLAAQQWYWRSIHTTPKQLEQVDITDATEVEVFNFPSIVFNDKPGFDVGSKLHLHLSRGETTHTYSIGTIKGF